MTVPLWLIAVVAVVVGSGLLGVYALCAAAGRADERLGYKDR